jgi:hypothetical protein
MPHACKSRLILDVAATFRVWRLERRFEIVDSRSLVRATEYGGGTRSREASRAEQRWQDISPSLSPPMRPWIGNHGFIAKSPLGAPGYGRLRPQRQERNGQGVLPIRETAVSSHSGKDNGSVLLLWKLCGRRTSLLEPAWLTYRTQIILFGSGGSSCISQVQLCPDGDRIEEEGSRPDRSFAGLPRCRPKRWESGRCVVSESTRGQRGGCLQVVGG